MKIILYLEQKIMHERTEERILNSENRALIEFGVELTKRFQGTLHVIMAGYAEAQSYLREALARGCDEATLLLNKDNMFHKSISRAVAEEIGENYDLVLTGYRMLNGGSGYIAPQIAGILNIPYVSMVDKVDLHEGDLLITRKEERLKQLIQCNMPCMLAVGNKKNSNRAMTVMDIINACDKTITIVDLPYETEAISPFDEITLEKITHKTRDRIVYQTMKIDEDDTVISMEEAVDCILNTMLEKGVKHE